MLSATFEIRPSSCGGHLLFFMDGSQSGSGCAQYSAALRAKPEELLAGNLGKIAIRFSAAYLFCSPRTGGARARIASILNSTRSLFDLLPSQQSTQQGTIVSRKATTIQDHVRFQVKMS
jgi:hypothetical protein